MHLMICCKLLSKYLKLFVLNCKLNAIRLKEDMIDNSFSDENFISGSEFKENLAEIEEVNRKEFGSLSESRFNFSLEGEK